MFSCKICNKIIKIKGVGQHLKTHNILIQDYYDIYLLKDKNDKKCKECGNITNFYGLINNYSKFCSLKCSNTNLENRRKNSISHQRKPRIDLIGKNNPAKNKDVRLKISNKLKGNTHTLNRKLSKQECENISKRVTLDWVNNPSRKLMITSHPKHYKRGYFYSDKNTKNFYYRSSYELQVFNILENDNTVLKYEYESIYIKYMYNNKIKHYIPDFIIYYNDRTLILEIKPKRFLNDKLVQIKAKYAREYAIKNNMSFEFWSELDILKYQTLMAIDFANGVS